MTTIELDNKSHGIRAEIRLRQQGGRWQFATLLVTREHRHDAVFSDDPGAWAVHRSVAVNMACQELDELSARLPNTQHQILQMWIKQTNRDAFAGISDERRAEMYQDERKARSTRK